MGNEYPSGNPFDHVVDIMKLGAIITRFKNVSRDGSLPPQERLVSYYIWIILIIAAYKLSSVYHIVV